MNHLEIQRAIDSLGPRSGRVHLTAEQHSLTDTVCLDRPSILLEGDVWAYSRDPNGVFEGRHGSQLRLHGKDFPALSVGVTHTAEGCMVRDLGIQGDIPGMDTRTVFDFENPLRSSGLTLSKKRVDQAHFTDISFCGLNAAISCCDQGEVDACLFERLKVDGCAMGAYFAPRAAYYVRFHEWVAADNPYYGVYVNAEGRQNKCMEITKIQFIRTGGAFTENDGLIHAAVCLNHLDTCIFRDNLIDDAGMFWYFADDRSTREERIFETVSLYVRGNENCIADNVIRNSHADSIHLYGDGNILMNNIADRNVVIEGNGNTVTNLVLTGPEAKLVIRGEGNRVFNVPEDRILRA